MGSLTREPLPDTVLVGAFEAHNSHDSNPEEEQKHPKLDIGEDNQIPQSVAIRIVDILWATQVINYNGRVATLIPLKLSL